MTAHTLTAGRHRNTGHTLWRAFVHTMSFVLFLAVVGGIGFGVYQFAVQSGTFNVETVRIEGANVLREQDILAYSGITSTDNLLFLQTSAIRDRVAAIPYIRTCEVQRTFPDTVVIRIAERTPAATLVVNNRTYEIDADHVVLREVGQGDPSIIPFITDVAASAPVEPGQKLDNPAIAEALNAWTAFCTTAISKDVTISEIAAPQANNICMYFNELPFEIRWGRNDLEAQAKRLDVLWQTKEKWLSCAEYLDLRFDRDVACK